jgi:hypothetical protein
MASATDLYTTNSLLTKADDKVSLLDINGIVVSKSEDQGNEPDHPMMLDLWERH